jgi:hypothetical protein
MFSAVITVQNDPNRLAVPYSGRGSEKKRKGRNRKQDVAKVSEITESIFDR